MAFRGYFTNGAKRDLTTMEFGLSNFKAIPDAGIFSGDLKVINFLEPDIKLQLQSKFNLDFLAKFLNLNDLEDVKGAVELEMNLHDIIDLRHPEKSIEKLNESYYTKLKVKDLSLKSQAFHFALEKLNVAAELEGHKANISRFDARIGRSDISVKGTISDLPAIVHHSDQKVSADLTIKSGLLAYNPPPASINMSPKDHEAVFNIFDLPFIDIKVELDIAHLNYHKYLIDQLKARLRMQQNHYIYSDECSFYTAGGRFDVKGYFNGFNPKEIYFSPDLVVENVDLDKLMLKFENFGQDHLISENLHGKISCGISGKVRMHADLVPILDKSELLMDVEIVNGILENYKPLEYVDDYFKDKNLSKIRFDTLQNEFEFKNSKLIIPKMTINSSLGFLELWGEQNLNMNMDFFFKIPLKLISKAAFQKLFKRKQEEVDLEKEDAIQYQDKSKKIVYVNINMKGNPNEYSISLKRDKRMKKERKKLRKRK